MLKIFLSFDFYGAGNIGDDLMLEGFLQGIDNKHIELYCSIPRNSSHQELRFPQIKFAERKSRYDIAGQCPVWIGVGDTPVQVKSNEWFLKKLLRDSDFIKDKDISYFFIGIGAEKEALREKNFFMEALKDINHIWTRDESTTEFLVKELSLSPDKVSTSSDLANIALNKIFLRKDINQLKKYKYDIGLCYYDEDIDLINLQELKSFLKELQLKNRNILIFGNDVNNKGLFEYQLYKKMFKPFERLFNNSIEYYQPDYCNLKTTKELVNHYSECEIIIASRYHALLTAAWAGCKVVSIERSSKVSALAEELGIHEVKKPFTSDKLFLSLEEAKKVDRNILNTLLSKAEQSMNGLNSIIQNLQTES